jgi:DNA repair protein RecN (Recombination protein N)
MLTQLQIRDFAIIESAELELARGLTALTGETGAGKSILVDAVMLAIGARADAGVVRHGCERAEISAVFDLKDNAPARAWLREQELAEDGEVILRRTVGSDGRSRAYINGQTQPLQQLRALGEHLIDIHGQQEFLTLTRREAQRDLLDAHGDHAKLQTPVAEHARTLRALERELAALKSAASDRDSRLDLLRYQAQELAVLALEVGEVEKLLAESQRLSHRGKLAQAAEAALKLLYDGDSQDAHALVGRAAATLRPVSDLDPKLQPAIALVEEALIPLKEAGRALADYLDSLDADPRRQEFVESRIASIEQLARKHRVEPDALVSVQGELERELNALERADITVADLQREADSVRAKYDTAAAELTRARRTAALALSTSVTALMRGLGMPGGVFEIAVNALDGAPDPSGRDVIEFLVSANPGQPPKPIAKVASGGELSRISLAVQVAAAHQSRGPSCMIFDEVDAGVGGAVAEMVGRELAALGRRGQALCVTHLPQVASQADHHIRVAKLSDGKTSRTRLSVLSVEERIEELARMLAGVEVTESARSHARELLERRSAPNVTPKSTRKRR